MSQGVILDLVVVVLPEVHTDFFRSLRPALLKISSNGLKRS